MSSDLSVKITKNINLHNLLKDTELVLQKMLLLAEPPILTVQLQVRGVNKPINFEDFDVQNEPGMLIVRIQNEKEAVAIVLTEVESHPMIKDSETGLWAEIIVSAMRTPLEFILAASLAIALAEEMNVKIIDDAKIWSHHIEQEPEELFQGLKLKKKMPNIYLATEEVFSLMPKNK